MAIDPLSVYRVVADDKANRDEKNRRLDALYGITDPATSAPIDLRAASNDPAVSIMSGSGALNSPIDPSLIRPAAAPNMSDAFSGGMSLPPASAPVAPQVTPAGNMSTPSGGTVTAPAPVVPKPSPGGVEVAPPPRGPLTTDEQTNIVVGNMAEQLAGGTGRGRVIPEHDKLLSTQVTQGPQVPEEIKARIEAANKGLQSATQEATDAEVKRHVDAAFAADIEARGLKKERGEKSSHYQAVQDELRRMDEDYEKLVKDTAVQPGSYWSSKDVGGGILAAIGAIMFGLAQDPEGLKSAIERNYAQRNLNRDKQLSAARQSIEDFKSRMMSPEAAELMDRSFADRAAAAEAKRLTEAAAAPEARARGEATVAQLEASAAQKAEEGARIEGETRHSVLQHVQAAMTGGKKTDAQLWDYALAHHLDPAGFLRAAHGGQYSGGLGTKEQRDEAAELQSRAVRLPSGETLYIAKGDEGAKNEIQAGQETLKTIGELQRLSQTPGAIASPETRARIHATITAHAKDLEAMGIKDPGVLDPASPKYESTGAALDQAQTIISEKLSSRYRTLYRTPYGAEPGGRPAGSVEVK